MPADKKVFISSTVQDLAEYRQIAQEACLRAGMLPMVLEDLSSTPDKIVSTSLRLVDAADIYLGIFAHRYGFVPPESDVSISELEYDRARSRAIPTLIFLMHEDAPVALREVERGQGAIKLDALKRRLQQQESVSLFKSPTELGGKILQSLMAWSTPSRAPVCFLAIPSTEEFQAVRDVISKTLSAEGITNTSIHDSDLDFRYGVTEALERADIVVADITDSHPNVLFEAGIAVGMRKPLLLLGHDRSRVPLGMRDRQIILYRPSEIESLAYFIKRWVKESIASPAALRPPRT
jgi:Domain of unknown function (DUF4062)